MTCLRSQSQWAVEPKFEFQRPMAAELEHLATLSCQNNHLVCLLCLGTKHEISHLIFPAAPLAYVSLLPHFTDGKHISEKQRKDYIHG